MHQQTPLRLRKRAEFLLARSGQKLRSHAFMIEAYKRENTQHPIKDNRARIGITVTRKNGNAVKRNRIKRRIKEAVRVGLKNELCDGIDYVIVARRACLNMPFHELIGQLKRCISLYDKAKDEIGPA